MKEFLTMGIKEINIDRWVPPMGIDLKPRIGGLWSSTYYSDRKLKSAWIEWCDAEMPHWVKNYGVVFTLKENTKIFTLDTMDDFNVLLENYGVDDGISDFMAMIDYSRLSQDYQAFYLTEQGEALTRFSRPALYGFDCESLLILDIDCIDTQRYVEW